MGQEETAEYLTVHEVATILRLSELTIYKYIKQNDLRAVEFGGHYRVSREELNKFVERHKVGGSSL